MNLRSLLSRFRRLERRWIPPKPERDAHEEVVRGRLPGAPERDPKRTEDEEAPQAPAEQA